MSIIRFPVVFLSLAGLLCGCSLYAELPAGTVREIAVDPVLERVDVAVPAPAATEDMPREYQVGTGDVLVVNVGGKPELSSAASRIDGSGAIRLPLVGSVPVVGLTLRQIQDELVARYGAILREPWVTIEISEYRSQPLNLLGSFNQAGVVYLQGPCSLLQGLALGQGPEPTAHLGGARLIRGGKTLPVDIHRLLREGDASQNTPLQGGDTIFIPNQADAMVFVFGAVKQPGPQKMNAGRLTLGQAMATAGLDIVGGKETLVRIIRSLSPTRGQLLVVDLDTEMQGRTLPFILQDGDVVFVPRSAIRGWNEAIGEILPSLNAVSAMLNPFVQIMFLTDNY